MTRRVAVSLAFLLAALGGGCSPRPDPQPAPELETVERAPGARGSLRISHYRRGAEAADPTPHRTVWVRGPRYAGVEDNDLRGFLDGRFKHGWNQPGQIHVRVGRRGTSPAYGGHELFRVLLRWEDLRLPPTARVDRATLRLSIERGPSSGLSVRLYEVRRDWNPGQGGVRGNNNSPPRRGEVWWNDAAFGEEAWGLPGAGYSSDLPDADVGPMPLADDRYEPGDDALVFDSKALARYVEERARTGQPVLLLLKADDFHEDEPDHRIYLYSSNEGDSRTTARRPQLDLRWSSASEVTRHEEEVFIEYGRRRELPRIETPGGGWFAVSFASAEGYSAPRLEVRGGDGETTSEWRRVGAPFEADWSWIQVRVQAVHDPVVLGSRFEAELVDTWTPSGPPEAQEVRWYFRSPTGALHEVLADYAGDHRWVVRFTPQDLGPWRYRWTQNFVGERYESAVGRFDVVGGGREDVRRGLRALRDRLRGEGRDEDALRRWQIHFNRLERAALWLETPRSYRSAEGRELYRLIGEVRALMAGQPIPESVDGRSPPGGRPEGEGLR